MYLTLRELVERSQFSIQDWPFTKRREAVLQLAYQRRACFICEEYGDCRHREGELELAIAQHLGIGAETVWL